MRSIVIPVAHDFICPWCWVGLKQAQKLIEEENVEIDWIGYELFPPELEWSSPVAENVAPNRPPTLTRFQFLLEIEKIKMPSAVRPHRMRTHQAHLACEYAKSKGIGFQYVAALYEAYWERGEEINSLKVLQQIGEKLGLDRKKLKKSVESEKFAENIIGFDEPAHKKGVYNVPTFFIGGERLAEQPYSNLRKAVSQYKERLSFAPYKNFRWPEGSTTRPVFAIVAVTTIDGKLTLTESPESAVLLGSKTDHEAMLNLIDSADLVIMGAATARAAQKSWQPTKPRLILTTSGKFDYDRPLFQDGLTTLVTPKGAKISHPDSTENWTYSSQDSMIEELLEMINSQGWKNVLLLGGSEINATFLKADLVDEIFVTIAPKIAGGASLPTLAGGSTPFGAESHLEFNLVGNQKMGDELFLHYRRANL